MTLVERIKELSKRRGKNIKQVAKEVGLGENAIYKWDTNSPKTDNLKKVAEYFNVSTDYLLGVEGAEEQQETEFRKALENVMSFDGEEMTEADKEAIIAFMMGRKGKWGAKYCMC